MTTSDLKQQAELKQQEPLRILMIAACPFPWPRGTPVRIQQLAQALVEEGHTVDVLTYHLGKATDELPFKVYRIANVAYYHRVTAGPSISKLLVLNPMLVFKLLKLGKTGDYDIIHAHHIEGVMTAFAARTMGLKLPIVYDAHTLVGSELLDYGPPIGAGIKHYIGNFLDHHFARKADSVIAVTDSIKAEFLKRDDQPANQIYIIPNGIEEDFIQRAAQAESDIVESIKAESIKVESIKVESSQVELEAAEPSATAGATTSPDEGQTEVQLVTQSAMQPVTQNTAPVFMFAGNMAAYQGIDLMLKAFALVVKTLPDAKLKILSHEPFSAYQAFANSLGISENLSLEDIKLDELPAMLVQADVLLNPRTRCTGIPQKLLNYMAAGRPVVSFSGSGKIVTDRVDGLIVENGNVPAFAAAMFELVNNPELGKTLAAAGLRSMQVRYSWRSAARKTLTVYSDTLSKYAEK